MRYKLLKFEWPLHWPFKITKVKRNHTNGLSIHASLLMFNSNIWPSFAPLRDIRLQILGDVDIALSRLLKVKRDGVIGLPIYRFLLMFNSNIWPNSAPSQNISEIRLTLTLIFEGHSRSLRSNVITSMYFPYMLSYYCFIVTYDLTLLLYKI